MRRVFLVVLDSFGIGAMPDAPDYGDIGVNTLRSIAASPAFRAPNLGALGLFHIDGVEVGDRTKPPKAVYARLAEASKGKDTTIGHWEIAGIRSREPLPVYPNGFPEEVLGPFRAKTGRGVLCNRPYSGTEVIRDYGARHLATGDLIVYTSADSVFQIAAHEQVVPLEELYRDCEIARQILQGRHGVGRVIARPFIGEEGHFLRTAGRHDYSLSPPGVTMLDQLKEAGLDVIAVGKIRDIFAGRGITEWAATQGNEDGIRKMREYLERDFEGLCFVNLVDFDMLYGHRNDVDGYAKAIAAFDLKLPELLHALRSQDLLMITADHGCDPGYKASTDHSREYVPFLMYGPGIEPKGLGTRESFSDIGATVLQYFDIQPQFDGKGMLSEE